VRVWVWVWVRVRVRVRVWVCSKEMLHLKQTSRRNIKKMVHLLF